MIDYSIEFYQIRAQMSNIETIDSKIFAAITAERNDILSNSTNTSLWKRLKPFIEYAWSDVRNAYVHERKGMDALTAYEKVAADFIAIEQGESITENPLYQRFRTELLDKVTGRIYQRQIVTQRERLSWS